ncbi:PAS domain-containing protein [bacterium]|nr:PAS domain-containing protein [bacterium]
MEYNELTNEELIHELEILHKRLLSTREANKELSSQLQAKDAEVIRLQRTLEERLAEAIHRESEFRKSTEQYRSLVGNLPGAVYRCANDAYWTMEFISHQVEELTGYPCTDFINNEVRSYNSVILPEDVIKVVDAVNEGLKHREPYTIEYRLRHKDGSIIPVYERGAGAYDEDGELLWLDGVIFKVDHNQRDTEYDD